MKYAVALTVGVGILAGVYGVALYQYVGAVVKSLSY